MVSNDLTSLAMPRLLVNAHPSLNEPTQDPKSLACAVAIRATSDSSLGFRLSLFPTILSTSQKQGTTSYEFFLLLFDS
jgi:hypothetical protein